MFFFIASQKPKKNFTGAEFHSFSKAPACFGFQALLVGASMLKIAGLWFPKTRLQENAKEQAL